MSDNGNGNNQAGSAKRGFAIIIAFLVIIVVLVGVIAFLLGRNTGGSDTGTDTGNTDNGREVVNESRIILDEQSAQETIDEMRKQVEEGMFECSMSMDWTFDNGTAESQDAYVANSDNNRHPFYFDVVLDGSEDVIYSSPLIPVGGQLTNFKLDVPLSAGTYEAICKYTLVESEENQEPISAANFIITIKVIN